MPKPIVLRLSTADSKRLCNLLDEPLLAPRRRIGWPLAVALIGGAALAAALWIVL